LDFATFLLSCCFALVRLRGFDSVVAMTSPPLISFIAAVYAVIMRASLTLWIMDLNPDEAIAAQWMRADSLPARGRNAALLFSLRRASHIVALDGYMRDRLQAKGVPADRIGVIPPWSYDGAAVYDRAAGERFRREHKLDGRFVVMYAGNHSPCHPLTSLLCAA